MDPHVCRPTICPIPPGLSAETPRALRTLEGRPKFELAISESSPFPTGWSSRRRLAVLSRRGFTAIGTGGTIASAVRTVQLSYSYTAIRGSHTSSRIPASENRDSYNQLVCTKRRGTLSFSRCLTSAQVFGRKRNARGRLLLGIGSSRAMPKTSPPLMIQPGPTTQRRAGITGDATPNSP